MWPKNRRGVEETRWVSEGNVRSFPAFGMLPRLVTEECHTVMLAGRGWNGCRMGRARGMPAVTRANYMAPSHAHTPPTSSMTPVTWRPLRQCSVRFVTTWDDPKTPADAVVMGVRSGARFSRQNDTSTVPYMVLTLGQLMLASIFPNVIPIQQSTFTQTKFYSHLHDYSSSKSDKEHLNQYSNT